MMEIKINDKFVFRSENGMDYRIKVIYMSNYREPSMKYGCDVWDENGNYAGDVTFVGDDFFNNYKERLERIED